MPSNTGFAIGAFGNETKGDSERQRASVDPQATDLLIIKCLIVI